MAGALTRWPLASDAHAHRINVSENITYLVTSGAERYVLRLHRIGYHSRAAIESELAWIAAIQAAGTIATPAPVPGRDGKVLQEFEGRHRIVLFAFVEGDEPDPDADLAGAFRDLGQIAAKLHSQAQSWTRPPGFTRLAWDTDAVLGAKPVWGSWRDGPNVGDADLPLIARAEALMKTRLAGFGSGPERFGLIHADMRAANILLGPEGPVVIDFDDCGFGWFMYDFAAAVSFIEDHPDLEGLKDAWCAGYRSSAPLPEADAAEIDTFVMFRRLALLGWIGSHQGAPEPDALAPHFAEGTAALADRYLSRFG